MGSNTADEPYGDHLKRYRSSVWLSPDSWLIWCATAMAILHFPLVVLRFGLLMGGDGPWMDVLVIAGPGAALVGVLYYSMRRRFKTEAVACALIFFGYTLAYATIWLASGRHGITFGEGTKAFVVGE